jgi:predicted metallopeptidase
MALFLLFWGYEPPPTPSFFSTSLAINPEYPIVVLGPRNCIMILEVIQEVIPEIAHIKRTVGDI